MARTFLSCAPKSSISLMQLKLLPDEALDSFISRNFVYAQRWRDTSIKKWYGFAGVGHWTVSKIRNLVDIFGWDKHGGYSYLFHYHTNYYRGVFALDTMGWGYPPERMSAFAVRLVAAHETVKLCPACLHSDLRDLGFIYWRRSHQGYDIEVCAQHNIKLVSACGGCHKPLLADRHFLEAPWSVCECGYAISDYEPVANIDLAEWKFSKFIDDFFRYKYQLQRDRLADLIRKRLLALGLSGEEDIKLRFQSSMNAVHYEVFLWNSLRILKGDTYKVWGVFYVLAAIFEDFNSFAAAVIKEDVERCHVYSKFFRCSAYYLDYISASPSYYPHLTIPPSDAKIILG